MPEMDGPEATMTIREKEKTSGNHVPIIDMTAHALAADKERCHADGTDEYLAKPTRPDVLDELLARCASVAS